METNEIKRIQGLLIIDKELDGRIKETIKNFLLIEKFNESQKHSDKLSDEEKAFRVELIEIIFSDTNIKELRTKVSVLMNQIHSKRKDVLYEIMNIKIAQGEKKCNDELTQSRKLKIDFSYEDLLKQLQKQAEYYLNLENSFLNKFELFNDCTYIKAA